MRLLFVCVLALITSSSPTLGQESWILLQEYESPRNYALGMYYAGKLLWHVDWDSSENIHTVYTLNPYNLEVIDIIPSPIEQPWGITHDGNNFWMTSHGIHGQAQSQLAKIRADTSFTVEEIFDFDGYYFYGITCDSTTGHLWIANQTPSWVQYLLEFDPVTCEVIEWHPWPYGWTLGMQYWDGQIWANEYDYYYPDHTYIVNADSLSLFDVLIPPYACPEGIATNGVVWWISYWRWGNNVIQKLIPPGTVVHDIAAYAQIFPHTGILEELEFEPQAQFINYGSVPEIEVPFVCRIWEDSTGLVVYCDSIVYYDEIAPEEIVDITYETAFLEPNRDYTLKLYSNLLWDQHRNNDTLRVYVHTVGGIHDLAILSIIEPEDSEPLGVINPSIRVQNQGDYFEAVAPVHLEIEHPDCTVSEYDGQVLDLEPLEIDTIYFSPFNPPEVGEYVFTFDGMLPIDAVPLNDFVIMTCYIGLVHDVAPVEIISPEVYEPFQPIAPRVIVENLGDYEEEGFWVSCTVEDSDSTVYSEQGYCEPLEPGEQWQVVFYNFYPQYPANYTFNFITLLTGDEVPENDTLSAVSAVGLIYDVAPVTVIEPPEVLSPEPFTPSVTVSNQGNVPADGFYTRCRVDSGSSSLYDLQTWIPALNPDETDTAFFETITLSNSGAYRFLFITDWQLDNHPDNDTLEFWTEYPALVKGGAHLTFTDFKVEGGFPNPFNAQTSFDVYLPVATFVDLSLYNLSGRCVHHMNAGRFGWGVHRITVEAADLPSGIYIARITTEKWEESFKVVLLK
jgi:hypothetical protein